MAEGRGGVVQELSLPHHPGRSHQRRLRCFFLTLAATPPPAEEGSLEPLPRLWFALKPFRASPPCSRFCSPQPPSRNNHRTRRLLRFPASRST